MGRHLWKREIGTSSRAERKSLVRSLKGFNYHAMQSFCSNEDDYLTSIILLVQLNVTNWSDSRFKRISTKVILNIRSVGKDKKSSLSPYKIQ